MGDLPKIRPREVGVSPYIGGNDRLFRTMAAQFSDSLKDFPHESTAKRNVDDPAQFEGRMNSIWSAKLFANLENVPRLIPIYDGGPVDPAGIGSYTVLASGKMNIIETAEVESKLVMSRLERLHQKRRDYHVLGIEQINRNRTCSGRHREHYRRRRCFRQAGFRDKK
jgi:hypothetical protein